MTVSQQIDAMRALGTDPMRKLVGPRLVALLVSLPLLTVIADVVGIIGGGVVATGLYGLTMDQYLTSVREGITSDDIIGGVIKPLMFRDYHCVDCLLQRIKHRRRNCRGRAALQLEWSYWPRSL